MAVQVIDEAYGTAARWCDVADHLRSQAAQAGLDSEDPLVRELVYSVSYELRLDHSGGAACALRPQTEAGDVAWPPRIADVPRMSSPCGATLRTRYSIRPLVHDSMIFCSSDATGLGETGPSLQGPLTWPPRGHARRSI
jgi:hypothetical protein